MTGGEWAGWVKLVEVCAHLIQTPAPAPVLIPPCTPRSEEDNTDNDKESDMRTRRRRRSCKKKNQENQENKANKANDYVIR